MRQYITFIFLIVVININAFSQVQVYAIMSPNQKSALDINLYASKSISKNEKWSINCYALMETDPTSSEVFAEILPGIDFSPSKKWNLGLEFGLESNGKPRASSWIYYSGKKDMFTVVADQGSTKENYWYSFEYQHTFAKVFDLGMWVRRFTVAGPKIGLTLNGKRENALFKPNLFVVAGVDPEVRNQKRAILGITIPIQ